MNLNSVAIVLTNEILIKQDYYHRSKGVLDKDRHFSFLHNTVVFATIGLFNLKEKRRQQFYASKSLSVLLFCNYCERKMNARKRQLG